MSVAFEAPEYQVISASDLLEQYTAAADTVQRISRLDQRKSSLEAKIFASLANTTIYEDLEGLPEQMADSQEPEEINVPALSQAAYGTEFLSTKLSGELGVQETAVRSKYLGRQVVVKAVDSDTRPIRPWYFRNGVGGDRPAEPRGVFYRPQNRTSGIIGNVLLKDNLLRIVPNRTSRFRLDKGYLETLVIDTESGEPLIDIEIKGLWAVGGLF